MINILQDLKNGISLWDALKDSECIIELYELLKDSNLLYDKIQDATRDHFDSNTIYYDDFWDLLKTYTTPNDLINGRYTIEDLFDDYVEELEQQPDELLDLITDYIEDHEIIQVLEDEGF